MLEKKVFDLSKYAKIIQDKSLEKLYEDTIQKEIHEIVSRIESGLNDFFKKTIKHLIESSLENNSVANEVKSEHETKEDSVVNTRKTYSNYDLSSMSNATPNAIRKRVALHRDEYNYRSCCIQNNKGYYVDLTEEQLADIIKDSKKRSSSNNGDEHKTDDEHHEVDDSKLVGKEETSITSKKKENETDGKHYPVYIKIEENGSKLYSVGELAAFLKLAKGTLQHRLYKSPECHPFNTCIDGKRISVVLLSDKQLDDISNAPLATRPPSETSKCPPEEQADNQDDRENFKRKKKYFEARIGKSVEIGGKQYVVSDVTDITVELADRDGKWCRSFLIDSASSYDLNR